MLWGKGAGGEGELTRVSPTLLFVLCLIIKAIALIIKFGNYKKVEKEKMKVIRHPHAQR